MRFEEAYEGWNGGRLTQAEAARILGVCERSFRRYLWRYEADGLDGLIDRRLEQASILVQTPLPRMVGVGKVDVCPQFRRDGFVLRKLFAAVECHGGACRISHA